MTILVRGGWVAGVVALVGCVGVPASVQCFAPPPCEAKALVVVIGGAGGSKSSYNSLTRVVAEQCLPFQVEDYEWVHGGVIRFVADQCDCEYSRAAGRRLAGHLRGVLEQTPCKPIVLVAHSAGSAVALACAECLPPNSLERIILLAPSISRSYDLRPALICTREGIDVFCSEKDRMYLGIGIILLGTADGKYEPAAGRAGFRDPCPSCPDACLYAKVRSHPWDPCMAWTGHHGQHTGSFKDPFMRTQIVPLLWPAAPYHPLAIVGEKETPAATVQTAPLAP